MNIREALINQQPSLAGWREAQAEIARLDGFVHNLRNRNDELQNKNDELRDKLNDLRMQLNFCKEKQ